MRLLWPVASGVARVGGMSRIFYRCRPDMLAGAKWQTVSWRTGTKGKLKARFAAVRVRTADGPPQRIGIMASNICPAMKPGLSANTAAQAIGSRKRRPSRGVEGFCLS